LALSKEELKKLACEAIDKNRDKIVALGQSIFAEPELGYKEYKTAEKIKKVFDELGFSYDEKVALTGVVAPLKGKSSNIKLSIMGELDAVVAPEHPFADPVTGAAHSCGHNCMIAALAGVAYAIKDADLMKELDGDIVLMAVPAEEYVEIEFRHNLIQEGKVTFAGGKQEFIKLGVMDDIDMMIMQHTGARGADGIEAKASGGGNGFVGKLVRYIGKEAHAGGAPHLGINALNAASLGLQAVAMQRETFQDKDSIRVHPIITKGGDLVNVVPADVRIETYIRGKTVDAIVDANKKVTRAFQAGGDAIGAETIITDIPGYMPPFICEELSDLAYENLKLLYDEDKILNIAPAGTGSTDQGDISVIMPSIQMGFNGVTGIFHSKDFVITHEEVAYIDPAKALVMTAIDLLYDGAKKGVEVKNNFKAPMTKAEYLKVWGNIEE